MTSTPGAALELDDIQHILLTRTPAITGRYEFLTFDTRNPNSILSCLAAARENARLARQYITLEMWEQINRFYFTIQNGAQAAARGFRSA